MAKTPNQTFIRCFTCNIFLLHLKIKIAMVFAINDSIMI